MTDHKTEAESLLGAEWRNGDVAVAQLAEAQVHATLYLAEQQRIANLIAYTARLGIHLPSATGPLHRDIREGLGLA